MNGIKLYFCRHAQSMENCGNIMIDSPLSNLGREQAKKLAGQFNIVICSPLRRCQETLHYSSIQYDKLIINHNLRERIFSESNCLFYEKRDSESDNEFFNRVKSFDNELTELICSLSNESSILIIGHSYFFNTWYMNGCYENPPNAQIIEIRYKK